MFNRVTKVLTSVISAMTLATIVTLSNPVVAADDLISKIESSGELRVCYAEDTPWTFQNPTTGKWEGFTKDLAADLAADMGVELVDVDATWKTIVQSLKNGECDIVGASLFASLKRAKVVLFSDHYALASSTAYVHKNSSYRQYSELDQPGKVIIAKAGTSVADFAKRHFLKATVKEFVADTDAIVMAEVANKRADAFWGNVTKGATFLKENPQFPIRIIGDVAPLDSSQVVWAVDEGEYALQQLVNVWLFRHKESGKTAAHWDKWFGTPYIK